MKVEIEINKRLYDDIKEMCEFNNITVEEYILSTVSDNFYIMKYGDLNEKLAKREEKEKETIVVSEEPKEEPKKTVRKRTTKKSEEITEKKEEVIEAVKEVETETTEKKVTKRRTLKAK